MSVRKLSPTHIRDLTTPRFVKRVQQDIDFNFYRVGIADTHNGTCPRTIIQDFENETEAEQYADAKNTIYHNQTINHLFGYNVVKYGRQLANIHRDKW